MSNKRIKKKRQNQQYRNANYSSTSQKTSPVQDLRKIQEQQLREIYAKSTQNIIQLIDLTRSTSKTYNVFSKETLRTYLKSPQQNSIFLSDFILKCGVFFLIYSKNFQIAFIVVVSCKFNKVLRSHFL